MVFTSGGFLKSLLCTTNLGGNTLDGNSGNLLADASSGGNQVLNHPYVMIITNAGSSIILVYSVIGKQLFFTKKARTESN